MTSECPTALLSSLPTQLARKELSEAGQLIGKVGGSVEVEVPSVALISPVADVGDMPVGRSLDVNDEIYATTIGAVDLTPAEGHLTTLPDNADLPGREPERDQDRIEGFRQQIRTTMSRRIET